ncbi:hypothetical protein GCM10009850_047720 [Nonomuraea monospora]|uniref:Tail assembly chaperone n=1 Tax=Nonomuraea monospora TaxID=568818 RepID=A0ABN3CJF2_9ACTN
MGYKRPAKIYKLVFAEDDMAGLEVKARSMSTGDLLDMAPLLDLKLSASPTAEEMESIAELLERFADVLVSWNLEDEDDQPVPATLEGLLDQDIDFVMRIIMAWADAVSGVPAPLPEPSPGGEPSLAASIPMDVS